VTDAALYRNPDVSGLRSQIANYQLRYKPTANLRHVAIQNFGVQALCAQDSLGVRRLDAAFRVVALLFSRKY